MISISPKSQSPVIKQFEFNDAGLFEIGYVGTVLYYRRNKGKIASEEEFEAARLSPFLERIFCHPAKNSCGGYIEPYLFSRNRRRFRC